MLLRRTLTWCALLVSAVSAAQSPPPADTSKTIRLRIGYGSSSEFRTSNGDKERIAGPEIALQVPIGDGNRLRFYFEPSLVMGGRLLGGGADGDLFRFTVYARRSFGNGMYIHAGGGFAHAVDRGNGFSAQHGGVLQIGAGLPLRGVLTHFAPTVELNVFTCDQAQLRGIFVGLTGKLE